MPVLKLLRWSTAHVPAPVRRAMARLKENGRAEFRIDLVTWTSEGDLLLSGSHTPQSLVLRHRETGREVTVPGTAEGVRVPCTRVLSFGDEIPLASGHWELRDAVWTGRRLPQRRIEGLHVFTPRQRGTRLVLAVTPNHAPDEKGPRAQERLQSGHYAGRRALPLLDLVVFDSMSGRAASCNPRAVHDELAMRDLGLEFVWISADGQFTPPSGSEVVLAGSRAHYEVMARARYVVGNVRMPRWFRKREGQVYLQTWHGTPIKHLGLDIEAMADRREAAFAHIRSDTPQWDYLVSPNPYATPILRRAYGYEGEVLEVGYPRNDVLYRPGKEERAAAVRAMLGIPEDKKIVLYAPTWRDDLRFSGTPQELALDVYDARRALDGDHVLLVRAHRNARKGAGWPRPDAFVRDVSAYPDAADLLLISDVLVTDYSSAMVDFAGTGRPVVVFAPDLERYRDQVRGLYLDLEEKAPGPLLRTSGDVVAALRAGVAQGADEAFRAEFCPFDDGGAAARVIEHVFKGM
ncbi:CDP-glycerol glycerophosphotransferase family protein [Actinocorallia sp. A-T 12471]|uniref:CDP-glycerol glycerophosphotransferase family protein n=1 Tax=Actinocorallia sp. A-T 12471 TaxID=3089813 RepID=UPI0029CC7B60|nr:CDP-glycerol glycerophosphotransferase family protein [Actinocorallia sp. A-T 12471]MDX6744446.1 CDP-glycerol glycerophosphotransferase family protein [Actinocorallia sp. A-T 12471]